MLGVEASVVVAVEWVGDRTVDRHEGRMKRGPVPQPEVAHWHIDRRAFSEDYNR